MRKRGILLLFFAVFIFALLSFSSAQTEQERIRKALSCLDNRVNETSLSLEESVFAVLAQVPNNKMNQTIINEKSSSAACWPKTGCTLKETAQVVLAKQKLKQNYSEIVSWLLSQTGPVEQLSWFLQITISDNGPATCTLNYDDADYKISIGNDMKLTGTPGPCLTIDSTRYKLAVNVQCIDKAFRTMCESQEREISFLTNLLYKKSGEQTIFVSSITNSAAENAWTSEKINAKCFKQAGTCDYEGTLWATAALYVAGNDTSQFSPYLRALASANEKYFPSAFLYYVIEDEQRKAQQSEKIIQSAVSRPEGNFWEIPGGGRGKFYDTSLALLALGGVDSQIASGLNVKQYLFSVQTDRGCWNENNIRDTAFLIYSAGWAGMREPAAPVCGNNNLEGAEVCEVGADGIFGTRDDNFGSNAPTCQSQGYQSGNLTCGNDCRSYNVTQCVGNVTAQCNDNKIEGAEICECGADKICGNADDNTKGAECIDRGFEDGDLTCGGNCLGYNVTQCVGGGGLPDDGTPPRPPNDCTLSGYYCVVNSFACSGAGGQELPRDSFSCGTFVEACCTLPVEETPKTCAQIPGFQCLSDEVCAGGSTIFAADGECCLTSCEFIGDGTTPPPGNRTTGGSTGGTDEGGSSWVWIVILIILILLVVLGIIYRDKLRVGWFKFRGKAKTSKFSPPGQPPSMPMARRAPPQFGGFRAPQGMPQRPMMQQPRPPMARRPQSQKEKEMEDTLEKLKKMSE